MGGSIFPHLGTGVIQPNDLFFAVHAFLMASVQLSQIFIYERGSQKKFSRWAIDMLIIQWTIIITIFILEGWVGVSSIPKSINTFKVAGYWKAAITLVKYCPQVYLNYKRKSTEGWSIFNIMWDFTGGVLSILQQFIDMLHTGLTTGTYSFFGSSSDAFNIVKFLLGVLSIVFDAIFMTQHFILYKENRENINDIDKTNDLRKALLDKSLRSITQDICH